MTTSMFMSYVDQMSRLGALRVFQAARAASAPYQKAEWWDTLADQAYADDPEPIAESAPSLFTFNGRPVSPGELKTRLSTALGAGYEAA
jgi:hypothetical protein